jgi:phosphoserine phosphatase
MAGIVKLGFFDLEGTLLRKAVEGTHGVAPSAWTLIAQELGEKALAEEEETKRKWNNGEYFGYLDWMADTIKIHQKYSLTQTFFQAIMDSAEYHPGVRETFSELNKNEVITTLITGGFKAQADRAQIDLGINHAFAGCEYFWGRDGQIKGWNLLPCDYEGKVVFMEQVMREYQAEPENCFFVGDGSNDIPLARAVGTSISFNGSPQLEEVVTHVVRQEEGREDFKEILQYIS